MGVINFVTTFETSSTPLPHVTSTGIKRAVYLDGQCVKTAIFSTTTDTTATTEHIHNHTDTNNHVFVSHSHFTHTHLVLAFLVCNKSVNIALISTTGSMLTVSLK